jgi:5-methylcytosine-specific restriction endonuclease McrA
MKKKETKIGMLRRLGMPHNYNWHNLRYKNPPQKGVYWWHLSRFIRQRDVKEWGVCISCGIPITVDSSDAGHFIPAANCGRDLLFDLRNVNAECSHCNAWDELHIIGYMRGLDERYGKGTAEKLLDRAQAYREGPVVKDWSAKEYEAKIHALIYEPR